MNLIAATSAPYGDVADWLMPEDDRGARIHRTAWIGANAQIGDGARIGVGARIGAGARIRNNGCAIYAWAVIWMAWLVRPGVVAIGCEEHPIEDWLADECDSIPWAEYCTEAERAVVQSVVRCIAEQERVMQPWERGDDPA